MKTLTLKKLFQRYLLLPVVFMFGITTIIGTGGGGGDGGGGGTPNTLVFTTNGNPDWVAMQDGDGAWSTVDPDVPGGNVYTRTILDAAGRYGIALHEYDVDGNINIITVLQSTLAELANPTSRPSLTEHTVTINATNVSAHTVFSVSREDTNLAADGIGVLSADEGIRDLVAIENPGYDPAIPSAGVIIRDINVNGDITVPVDMNNFDVDKFTEHTFLITPQTLLDNISGNVKFVTANRTRSYGVTIGTIDAPTGYYSLDSGTISSDYYSIELQDAFDNGGIDSAIEIKRNAANPDINFDFTAITPFSGADATASQITGLSYTPDPGLPELIAYQVEYVQDRTAEVTNDYLALGYVATPGWLGSNSTYILPDFSGLPGFDPTWVLTPGVLTEIGFVAALYNVPLGVPLSTDTDWIPGLYMVQPMMRITYTP